MDILIALIPAIAWGSVGLVTTKMGGSAGQGTLGMTFGALIFGIATLIFFVIPNSGLAFAFNPRIWLVGFISGIFWAVGTAGQFVGFKKLGVSVGNPLSTAGQVVFNALMAAIVLGEWTTTKVWLIGSLAILLVVIGAIMTSLPDKNAAAVDNKNRDVAGGLIALAISTIGYVLYFVFPNLLNKIGYITDAIKDKNNGLDYMTAIVAPQSIGQVLGAFVIVIFFMHEAKIMFKAPTWRNIVTGLVWAIGNVFMFISTANPSIGQATAATLSQTGSIISVFGGVYLLHEKKTRRQMIFAVIGAIILIIGAILISKVHDF